MRTWFLNSDADPVLDASGNIRIIDGVDGLAEKIEQRFEFFRGKYFLALDQGVPYLEEILVKPVDPGLVTAILNAEILKEDEVTSIGEVEADLNPETRAFSYQATVNSIFGEVEVSTNG